MNSEQLISILSELSRASKSISSDNNLRTISERYDMLFLGKNFNIINTVELCHCLSKKFDIDISIEELNCLIPDVCSLLNMKCEPMAALDALQEPKTYCYQITLW